MGAILILDADGQWLSLTTSYDKVWRLQRWGWVKALYRSAEGEFITRYVETKMIK